MFGDHQVRHTVVRDDDRIDRGRWQVSGVPPGEYQVVFERFNHLTAFANITISAGANTRAPDPVLVFSTETVLAANATLNGVLRDNNGQRVVGATIAIPVTIRLCRRRAMPTGATKSTASTSVAIGFALPPLSTAKPAHPRTSRSRTIRHSRSTAPCRSVRHCLRMAHSTAPLPRRPRQVLLFRVPP